MVLKSIVIVDDEELFRDRLAKAFKNRGYSVFTAANFDEALDIISEKKPPLALVDLKMPGKSGLDLIREVKVRNIEIRIVVLTGYGSIATAIEAVKFGAYSYLPKPADIDDILHALGEGGVLGKKGEDTDFIPPSLARVEWEHINRVLTDCGGNISAAARKLGVHRRTLQRKLYKFAPPK